MIQRGQPICCGRSRKISFDRPFRHAEHCRALRWRRRAKLADGSQQCLPAGALQLIVNTGDDFEHRGLLVCPDLDTVL